MTTKSPPLILAVDDSAKMHKILQAKLKSEIAADKIRLQFFADPNTCLKFIKDNKDQQNMILLKVIHHHLWLLMRYVVKLLIFFKNGIY